MRRQRAAARAAGGAAVPTSDRKALAGKLKRAAASLKAKKLTTKPAKKPVKKKKPATKSKPSKATKLKVVGRIAPKADTPSPAVPGVRVPSGPVDPSGMVRTVSRAEQN